MANRQYGRSKNMLSVFAKATFKNLRSAVFPAASTFATMNVPQFETLHVEKKDNAVLEVRLNRPDKSNAMNQKFWDEMVECFSFIGDTDTRCVVLTGAGKNFTGGLDLQDFAGAFVSGGDAARNAMGMRSMIKKMQRSFTVIEECPVPVIASIHRACIGGGIDLVTACDVRLCSADTYFSIREVDIGLAADVGTLQRMPKIIGNDSIMRELAYTGRNFDAKEAKDIGLVSRVFDSKDACEAAAFEMAQVIAAKSPIAVRGTKRNLIYSRDHSVEEGMEYISTWNMVMLQSDDLAKAAVASMQKSKPSFDPVSSKL